MTTNRLTDAGALALNEKDPVTPVAKPPAAAGGKGLSARWLVLGVLALAVVVAALGPGVASVWETVQAQFDAWFGAGVSNTAQCQNVGRRPIELSLTYLPTYLLKAYCTDMATAKTHGAGGVYDLFKNFYTVAQLEAMNLWGKMDAKIASLGGCAHL